MSAQIQSPQTARPANPTHDLQAKLYRDIGISAVAAALRFTTQPEPPTRPVMAPGYRAAGRTTLAA